MSFLGGLMGTAETAKLAVELSLKDTMTAPLGNAERALGKTNTTAGGLKQTLSASSLTKGLLQGVGIGGGIFAFQSAEAAIKGLVSGVVDLAKAGEAEEATNAKVTAALQANISGYQTGTAAAAAYDNQINAAVKSGEALAFSQDEQKQALTPLIGVTHDVTTALALEREAMDLARYKNMSLTDAATLLGKVYNGNVSILNRYGITVQKGATATEALAALQQTITGQAQAFAANDPFAVLDVSAQALYQDVGTKFAPAIDTIVQGLDNIITGGPPAAGAIGDVTTALWAQVDAQNALHDATNQGDKSLIGLLDISDHLKDAINLWNAGIEETSGGTAALSYANRDLAVKMGITDAQMQSLVGAMMKLGYSGDVVNNELVRLANGDTTASLAATAHMHAVEALSSALTDSTPDMNLWSDSVDRQGAAVARTSPIIAGMAQHAAENIRAGTPAVSKALDNLFDPFPAKAHFAALKAAQDVGKIPVLMSDKLTAGIDLVKKAMADYELAITEPVSVAKEKAAIQAALTSKKLREGLKSHNPAIRADAVELVAWLEAKLAELNGLKVTIKGEIDETQIARQGTRSKHMAAGGPTQPGQTYVVNENGIEYLHQGAGSGWIGAGPAGGSKAKLDVTVRSFFVASQVARETQKSVVQHGVIAQ